VTVGRYLLLELILRFWM